MQQDHEHKKHFSDDGHEVVRLRSALLHGAALIIVLAGLSTASRVIVPFMMASFLAMLSAPVVNWMVARRIHRVLGVIVVVLLELGLITGLSGVVSSSINTLTVALPRYQRRLSEQLWEIGEWLSGHGVEVTQESLRSVLDTSSLFSMTSSLLGGFAGVASSVALVLLVAAFMLIEAPSLHGKLEHILEHWLKKSTDDPLERATSQVQRYLAVKTVTSLVTGALAGLLVWSIGLDMALFWGLVAFLLNFIPTIGSFLAALPPIILGWLMLGTGPAIIIFAGYLSINTVIGNVIEPRLMGRTLGLSPTVILLSMLFWGWLLGPAGALLSAPLTMIVKIVCEHIDEWRWFAELIDSPAGFEARNPDWAAARELDVVQGELDFEARDQAAPGQGEPGPTSGADDAPAEPAE